MSTDTQALRAVLLSMVENQERLAEAVTRLANEALEGEGIRDLAKAVSENNKAISTALQQMGPD